MSTHTSVTSRVVMGLLLAVSTACGSGSSSTMQPAAPDTEVTAPAATTTTTSAPPATTTTTTTVPATTTTTIAKGPGVSFSVAGGPPQAVVDEQLRIYGQVLDAAAFSAAYLVDGMVWPDGPGVIVVDHQQHVEFHERGATRFDTITYAFTDPRSLPELAEEVATALGSDLSVSHGWCSEGHDGTGLPVVIVCPGDHGEIRMQIIRESWVDVAPVPPVVAEHLALAAPVLAAGAVVSDWNVLRDPGNDAYPGGHAVTIGFSVDTPWTIADLLALYPGWQETVDDGYGPTITDGTHYWSIDSDTGLTYSTPNLAIIG